MNLQKIMDVDPNKVEVKPPRVLSPPVGEPKEQAKSFEEELEEKIGKPLTLKLGTAEFKVAPLTIRGSIGWRREVGAIIKEFQAEIGKGFKESAEGKRELPVEFFAQEFFPWLLLNAPERCFDLVASYIGEVKSTEGGLARDLKDNTTLEGLGLALYKMFTHVSPLGLVVQKALNAIPLGVRMSALSSS